MLRSEVNETNTNIAATLVCKMGVDIRNPDVSEQEK
jgi:hypothetical protein